MHPTNYWKLGLFVVVGFILAACTVVFLGARSLHKDSVSYKTYLDESVQGLEVVSPIMFRGVKIGAISGIDIAPDGRHVGVTSDLSIVDLKELGLSEGEGSNARIRVPDDLRVQLASQGLTGGKFLQIDFFVIKDNPPPVLPFPVPENYIPAAESTMKNLEDAIVHAVDRIPELAEGVLKVSAQVNRLLDSVEDQHLPENAAKVLGHVDAVVASLQRAITQVDAGKLSAQAQGTLAQAQGALAKLSVTLDHADSMLARVDGDKGLIASAQRTSDSLGDMMSSLNVGGLSQNLDETMRDIQEVAGAFQRLADALERDPDMLLKGRGK